MQATPGESQTPRTTCSNEPSAPLPVPGYEEATYTMWVSLINTHYSFFKRRCVSMLLFPFSVHFTTAGALACPQGKASVQ